MSGDEPDVTALLAAERPWEPEIALDEGAVEALLRRALPGLVGDLTGGGRWPLVVEPLGVGWDNAAYVISGQGAGRRPGEQAAPVEDAGGPWVFRFPRRTLAARLIETETALLPLLAPGLGVPVPVPEHAARDPAGEYPWLFAGYRRLAGETACRASLDDEGRSALAAPLGRLLRALHDSPAAIADLAPVDPLQKGDVHLRAPSVLEQIERVREGAPAALLDEARALCRRMPEVPLRVGYRDAQGLALVHGDLYARHLLVADGRLCGVIDWGDIHRGDPAVDVSIAFSFLPPSARAAFFAEYGALDEAAETRARFKAMHYGVALWHYGLEVGDPPLVAAGRFALEASLA